MEVCGTREWARPCSSRWSRYWSSEGAHFSICHRPLYRGAEGMYQFGKDNPFWYNTPMERHSPWSVLFSKTQQRVLGALFSEPEPKELSYSDLLRQTGGGAGAIHRELRQLVDAELIQERLVGGQRLYSPNTGHRIYAELRSLVSKLAGSTSRASLASDEPTATDLAKKYVWWKPPSDAVSEPRRLVAQVMNMGDYEDIQRVLRMFGAEFLASVIRNAEPGQFNERSWSYWNYRLGLAQPGSVPTLPARSFE
jgi:hypothetical protein